MKKYLLLISLFISAVGFSQVPRSRILLGQDTSTKKGGVLYYDTLKNLVCSGCTFNKGLYSDTLVVSATSQWTTSGSDIYYSTGKVTIGSSTINRLLTLDHATLPLLGLSVAGTEKALFGISSGTDVLDLGSVTGDLVYRAGTNMIFSGNSGNNTSQLWLGSNNKIGFGTNAPANDFEFRRTTSLRATWVSSITNGSVIHELVNNSANALQSIILASGASPVGLIPAGGAALQANATTLTLQALGTNDVIVGTNAVERLRFLGLSADIKSTAHIEPVASVTYDLGTSSLLWRQLFVQDEIATGAKSNGHVNVSGTGTYSALGTDYTIEFTGTTATLAYPTVNLVNGRHLNIINYGSGALTIPSTKTGNASTTTTLASNGRLQVEYDLATTTWIQIN